MAISDSYFKSRKRRKMSSGGQVPPIVDPAQSGGAPKPDMMGISGMVAGMGSQAIDALAKRNQYGRQSTGAGVASGALKGAAAGAALGPLGMAAGSVMGAGMGWIQGNKAMKEEQHMITEMRQQQLLDDRASSNAKIAANPELMSGSMTSQYFATGGKIDPTAKIDPNKAPLGRKDYNAWNGVVKHAKSKGFKPEQLDHDDKVGYGVIDEYNKANPNNQFDRNRVRDIQEMMLKYRETTLNQMKSVPANLAKGAYDHLGPDFEKYMPGLSPADNFPGSKTLNWEVPQSLYPSETTAPIEKRIATGVDTNSAFGPSKHVQKATGGSISGDYIQRKASGGLVQKSSDGVEVQGPSHENGGVPVPGTNAEVEGEETMKDNFVYSAQLGFAAMHKPLMRAKGKIEKKPASPERVNAIKLINEKEDQLAMAQEYFKKKHGIK